MKKMIGLVLCVCVWLCVTGCEDFDEKQTIVEDSSNFEVQDTTQKQEQAVDENSAEIIEEIVDQETIIDYSDVVLETVDNFMVIDEEDMIWCSAMYYNTSGENSSYLVQIDYNGVVYNKQKREDAKYAKIALTDSRVLFEKQGAYYIYDFKQDKDVTYEYLGENDKIIFANNDEAGVCIIMCRNEEAYNSEKMYFEVVDNEGECIIKFDTDEIVEKFGIDWTYLGWTDMTITACGSGIYHIKTGDLGKSGCFIDIVRKKVYGKSDLPQYNGEEIYSDGEYIIDSQYGHGTTIIDCDTECEVEFYSDEYAINGRLSEGIVYGEGRYVGNCDKKAYLDINGNVVIDLNYSDTTVTNVTQFKNGFAMLEFKESFVTIIDKEGNFLFEPVSGKIRGISSIGEKNIYLIYDNQYYLLDLNGNKTKIEKPYNLFFIENKKIVLFTGEKFVIMDLD